MEGLAMVREGIGSLRAQSGADVTDEQVVGAMAEFHRLESMFAAQRSRFTDILDERKLWRADGSKAFWAWLSRTADMSPTAAKAVVGLAKRLRQAPLTKEVFETGDIDRNRAVELSRRAASHRKVVADAFGAAEAELVAHAKTLSFDGLCRVLRYWEAVVDDDGEEAQGDDDHLSRNLHVTEILRAMVRIDGTLDAIGGAIVAGELARIEKDLFDVDCADARAVWGDDTRPEHLTRSPSQRRADALTEMARRSAAHQPRKSPDGSPRPLFSVHIGPDTVARMCELASGTVIAPGLLVPYLGEADIERIIHGPRSRVIDLSKRARFFTGGLRRAIELRDRWCTHPGCTEPAENGHIDHVTPRSHNGETTQQNARARCDTHN
ncbi:MAG TPA: DUF222 domain-containing protein [Acidimicrobiales bacterium]|nr:DUF222 domain-containing protein [Acidimicrobiales bacterium]